MICPCTIATIAVSLLFAAWFVLVAAFALWMGYLLLAIVAIVGAVTSFAVPFIMVVAFARLTLRTFATSIRRMVTIFGAYGSLWPKHHALRQLRHIAVTFTNFNEKGSKSQQRTYAGLTAAVA